MIKRFEMEQKSLQDRLCEPSISIDNIQFIAGIDVQHSDDIGIGYVAYQIFDFITGTVVEEDVLTANEEFSYVPGFLYYREKVFLEKAFNAMKIIPDVIACDGNGILHPLMVGEAAQFGIVNNIPTLGIAKHKYNFDGLTELGDKLYINDVLVGQKVYLNDESKTPMYVSGGYKIDTKTAVEIVKHMQKFSLQKTKNSYLTKGVDHLARMKQHECET